MLSVKALNAHYGTSHVLHGVDLELYDSTILAVLGRNGVGKTTTVRTIMGLVRPSSGNVFSTARTSPVGRRTGSPAPG